MLAMALLAALLALATGASADGTARRRKKGASLRQCLQLADRNHPNILQGRAELARVRAQLNEAYFAPFSQFNANGGIGPAPTVRGNNVFSPNTDQSLTSNLGLAWRVNLDGVLPLWTFGKIENLWDAAEANVEVTEAQLEVTRDAVRFDVRKAYLGLQLARDGLDLLGKAEKQIDDVIADLEEDGDPIDLLKMRTFRSELKVRRSEAEKYVRVARAGLRFFTGVPRLRVRDEPLKKSQHHLGHVSVYLGAARRYRPEVAQARAGVAARKAQLALAEAQLFPDFGVVLSVGYARAPEVADQINPWVSDGGNYFHYGAALAFQWRLDFLPAWSRIQQAEAQLQEVMALDRKALGGVAAQVEEAYAEAEDWQRRLAAYREAEKYAKQWLATVKQAIEIGTMEDRDLIDPSKAWAEHRYNVLNALMQFNLALAKLAQTTGWDAIAPGG
jgi:outer membrane protein TolC